MLQKRDFGKLNADRSSGTWNVGQQDANLAPTGRVFDDRARVIAGTKISQLATDGKAGGVPRLVSHRDLRVCTAETANVDPLSPFELRRVGRVCRHQVQALVPV